MTFLPWNGGKPPVGNKDSVVIKLRSGLVVQTDRPHDWMWGRAPSPNPGEIVEYRILQESVAC